MLLSMLETDEVTSFEVLNIWILLGIVLEQQELEGGVLDMTQMRLVSSTLWEWNVSEVDGVVDILMDLVRNEHICSIQDDFLLCGEDDIATNLLILEKDLIFELDLLSITSELKLGLDFEDHTSAIVVTELELVG